MGVKEEINTVAGIGFPEMASWSYCFATIVLIIVSLGIRLLGFESPKPLRASVGALLAGLF